jgi:hypothetical protein
MVIAYSSTLKKWVQVDGVIGRGRWFARRWLVGIGMGFECGFLLVESCDESSVIDEIVDNKKWKHWVVSTEPCPHTLNHDECDCMWGGNYGERLDYEERIFEKVAGRHVQFFATERHLDDLNEHKVK